MPPAARVCMAMSINSSLRTSGEQTNKCSFRHGSNLLRTTAPLCFLCVSQAATAAWICQSLISAHARGQFHVQMLVEAHTASRPESFGMRSIKQVVTSPGQLNNSFRDFCQLQDSLQSLISCCHAHPGLAAHGELVELHASKHATPPELHSHMP